MWRNFLLNIFATYTNRHYTNKLTSRLYAGFRCLSVGIALMPFALATDLDRKLLLGGFIVYCVVDFFVFDYLSDKYSWKYVYRHFYKDNTRTDEHILIKKLDKNPTPENIQKIKNHITMH